MMTIAQRIAALAACSALLAGCGGGGSSPAAPASVALATAAPKAVATGTPIATASLTLKFPAGFHTARKATAKSARTTKYINPTNNNIIDIFVDGVDVVPNYTVSLTGDGTQTINSVPIYSTSSHQIVVIESENGYTNTAILALGETDLAQNAFTPGDVFTVGLTMAMNVSVLGITSDPSAGSDATINTSSAAPFYDFVQCSAPSTSSYPMYLFAADAEGGFISGAGLGVPIPALSGYTQYGTSPPELVTASTTGLGAGYSIYYPNYNGSIYMTATVINPAYAFAYDAIYNNGTAYPGLRALFYTGTTTGPLYSPLYNVYYQGQTLTNPIWITPSPGC